MTIQQIERAAFLLGDHYKDTLDCEGNHTVKARMGEIDLMAPCPPESANSLRKEVITRLINGKPINFDGLSEWAKISYRTWERDAWELVKLGVSGDAP